MLLCVVQELLRSRRPYGLMGRAPTVTNVRSVVDNISSREMLERLELTDVALTIPLMRQIVEGCL